MTPDDEYKKGWNAALHIQVLCNELATKEFKGKYGQARRRRIEAVITAKKNYLTPPAKLGAARWQREVIDAVWAAFRANEQIAFAELLDLAIEIRGVPKERAVRRFLNRMGFQGKPGASKKHP